MERLDDLNKQVELQLSHLMSVTNHIEQIRADLHEDFVRGRELIKRSETNRLAEQARDYQTMMADSLPNTLSALKLNPPNEIARVMFYMAPTNRAVVMNALASDPVDPQLSLLKSIQDAYKKIIIDEENNNP